MQRAIPFSKMTGSGNDFVMVDNRRELLAEGELVPFTQAVCPRRTSVGADGAIFLQRPEPGSGLAFHMRYFNADGSEADMCGNGARCIALFAAEHGAAGQQMRFQTGAGPIEAWITAAGVKVELTRPSPIARRRLEDLPAELAEVYHLDTGVPHAVVFAADAAAVDVRDWGRRLRHHGAFAPAGTNVNFVQRADGGLAIRTYERGVEDETLACGTGATASALAAAYALGLESPRLDHL